MLMLMLMLMLPPLLLVSLFLLPPQARRSSSQRRCPPPRLWRWCSTWRGWRWTRWTPASRSAAGWLTDISTIATWQPAAPLLLLRQCRAACLLNEATCSLRGAGVDALPAHLLPRLSACLPAWLQSHPEEMELIMRAACTQPASRPPRQRQQQQQPEQQQGDGQQAAAAAAAAAEQQQRREEDDEWLKPVVVLVGATMEDSLIEHVVQEVRGSGSGSGSACGSASRSGQKY